MRELLLAHARRYPLMGPRDAVKLVCQSALGGGHLVTDPERCAARIEAERAPLAPVPGRALLEEIGGAFRLYLDAPACAALTSGQIAQAFAASAAGFSGGEAALGRGLDEALALAAEGALPFSAAALRREIARYFQSGCAPVSHSAGYRAAYAPAYRVLSPRWARAVRVLAEAQGRGARVVALDGPAASGKTTLAGDLQALSGCAVIHMDDFFPPAALRTPARLAEPGGNVHYERFLAEVIAPLSRREEVRYRRFDCKTMDYAPGLLSAPAGAPVTVEGSYSHHPRFGGYADLRVFLALDKAEQLRRLRLRESPESLERFLTRWVPMEDRYFAACGIPARADLTV